MDVSATVTSKGQVTIPAALRDRLGLKTGDRVRFFEGPDGDVRIERRATVSFDDLRGMIDLGRPVSQDEIDQWVREARTAIGGGER